MDIDVHFMLSSFIVKSLVQCRFSLGIMFSGEILED